MPYGADTVATMLFLEITRLLVDTGAAILIVRPEEDIHDTIKTLESMGLHFSEKSDHQRLSFMESVSSLAQYL